MADMAEGRALVARSALALTDRMSRYVELRAKGIPPVKAGLGAGLAPSNVHATVRKWEEDQRIIEAVVEAQQIAGIEVQVAPADILRELMILAFSTIDDYVIDEASGRVSLAEDAPPSAMRAVQAVERRVTYTSGDEPSTTITTKIKLWDKPQALRMFGDHFAMWLKRVRIEDDGETRAALQELRKYMGKVVDRGKEHADEDARLAAFHAEQHLAEMARLAGAVDVAIDSQAPTDATRALGAILRKDGD